MPENKSAAENNDITADNYLQIARGCFTCAKSKERIRTFELSPILFFQSSVMRMNSTLRERGGLGIRSRRASRFSTD